MAASQTDKFKKAGLATVTTLAAPGKALAATSITVGSTTNFPTGTGLIVAIRQVNTAGTLVAGTYTEWRATVTSGTSLAIEATPVAGSDQVYAAGSTTQVFVPLSSYGYNELVDGLLVSLDQDGTLKAGAVDNAAVLASDVVTTAKILDANVTLAKINGGATAGVLQTSASGVLSILSVSTSYTPTWTSSGTAPSLGNGTLTGAYTQIGKLVEARIAITFGSTTTYGTGNFYFSLPVTAKAISSANAMHVAMQLGTGTIADTGVNYYPAAPRFVDVNKIEVGVFTTLSGANPVYAHTGSAMSATVPFTMGNTDGVYLTIRYEAA